MRTPGRALLIALCALSFLVSVPVLVSVDLRRTYWTFVQAQAASLWPPDYVFVGDSLTRNCPWRWSMGRPLSTIVLAVSGQEIWGMIGQVVQSRTYRATHLFIAAGINDVISGRPVDQIGWNFDQLLRNVGPDQRVLVTLMPYVSDAAWAPKIRQANDLIAETTRKRGHAVIDINPAISENGARRAQMTQDGLHFTSAACAVWIDAVKDAIPKMK